MSADEIKPLLRVVSTDGSFRRGGHRFGPEPVLLYPGDIPGPEQLLAILGEARLDVQRSKDGGETFEIIPTVEIEELAAAIAAMREAEQFEAGKVDPSAVPGALIPDPAGPDPAQAPGAAADQTKDAADDEANSSDTGGASTAAAADGGSSAGRDGEDGNSATADAAPSAEENNGGADPAPVPVAAPKSKPSGRKPKG